MDAIEYDQVLKVFVLLSLRGMIICDRETRTHGRIIKSLCIVDLQGFSAQNLDTRFFRILGEASKLNEKLFPQMLGKTVCLLWLIFDLLHSKTIIYFFWCRRYSSTDPHSPPGASILFCVHSYLRKQ